MDQLISNIRQFNRYYTKQLGLLQQHFFDTDYSLTDIRVLYEIDFNGQTTATGIREALQIDAGYLSRILRNFEKKGLILKHPLPEDGRSYYLQLTARGKKLMAGMNERSNGQIREMLKDLRPAEREKIANSMNILRNLLKAPDSTPALEDVVIRHGLQPGDIGDMIRLHGILYAQEYQYDLAFETYVTQTLYEFMQTYDPARDRVWLAYCYGELIGMIAIIGKGRGVAQLRWFLLRPEFRGIGLGKKLMGEAMAFCRQQNFRSVYLLTTHQQTTAGSMYTKAGFVKTASTPQRIWGHDLYEERYELKLR
ncbi:bifunctional helix-turn-helix transcriptional regulator/GNAT family N-acetyltransferase [Chitinophaga niabensis]|uniref:DNA-binding transcriptional regulator, MarR family n=1 Tax=Chitinophaga niabensis TaxID=536979 RepID=A0A1N6EHZ2_9BACT|nr:bifunctional helix-turn-helix transcriptional regulator/GNAT family N-acetyltransferase [Chitinophaga niabensis]SIN82567.1 DNA-binding transcriptional regulator, MarR family [Chitinophaga niabensis]